MQTYVQVSNQREFDEALDANINTNKVIVIINATESIIAYDVKNTIEVRDGTLVAAKCKNIIAMNNAKVLAYYSVVYGNDNSFILNKNSTCLLYDLAASEKIF